MSSTSASIQIPADPDRVWQLIGGFDSAPDWRFTPLVIGAGLVWSEISDLTMVVVLALPLAAVCLIRRARWTLLLAAVASVRSIEVIFACGSGERTMRPWIIPGRLMS